jgi:hypothetical protein
MKLPAGTRIYRRAEPAGRVLWTCNRFYEMGCQHKHLTTDRAMPGVQGSLQQRFGQLFEQFIFANQVFGLLVARDQLIAKSTGGNDFVSEDLQPATLVM